MGYILKDVYDLRVYDAKTGEFLFDVTSTLDNKLTIEVQESIGTLYLTHCYFNDSVLNEIGSGKYKERQLRLELIAEARDHETGEDIRVKTTIHNGKLLKCEYVSNPARFMVNNLLFQVIMQSMTDTYKIDVEQTKIDPDA